MRYNPTYNSTKAMQAINRAYAELPENERKFIDRQARLVKNEIENRKGENRTMVGEESLIELIGKVGMWLVLNEEEQIEEN